MTFNDVMAVTLLYSIEFGSCGANDVEVVEGRQPNTVCNKNSKNLVFRNICFMPIFAKVAENEFVRERHAPVKSDNVVIFAKRCEIG